MLKWLNKIWFKKSKNDITQESAEIEDLPPGTGVELSSMKVVELKALAKELGIKGYYKMNKTTLVEALTNNHSS